jgi:fluoride exporter
MGYGDAMRHMGHFELLAIMVGGALGVALRVGVSSWIAQRFGEHFPWGTFVANASGCLMIGLFAGLTGPDGAVLVPPWLRATVMIGVLGGYTTFSSFSLQTLNLASDGQWVLAAANVIASVVVCLVAVWVGFSTAHALQPRL